MSNSPKSNAMKNKENVGNRESKTTTDNEGGLNSTYKSKQLPNEVKQNHRTGHNTSQPRTLKAFLSDKLPHKTVSDKLALSIKEKNKSISLIISLACL